MNGSASIWFQNLQPADLEPIVRQILDRPAVEVVDWQIKRMGGGVSEAVGIGRGVNRVTGTARADGEVLPWSVVAKIFGPSELAEVNDPTFIDYWKREVLVYQSGILRQLPGGVVAPRCYAIQALPDEMYCLWLELVQEVNSQWTIEQHRLAAHLLGRFNGAYLTGQPLPEADWMTHGRTRSWVEQFPPDQEKLLSISATKLGGWLSQRSIERMLRLWEQSQPLLAALDRLPPCFCHHDAFRRNLMFRQAKAGMTELVALDWPYAGLGGVGQEIAVTTAVALWFLEVSAENARAFDQAVFAAYMEGLRDVGWGGDQRLVRFGYTATAALAFGLVFGVTAANAGQDPDAAAAAEAAFGHPIDVIMEQWAVMEPFLLDLGDEALALLPSV